MFTLESVTTLATMGCSEENCGPDDACSPDQWCNPDTPCSPDAYGGSPLDWN